jgi:signal recognition particle GTPase
MDCSNTRATALRINNLYCFCYYFHCYKCSDLKLGGTKTSFKKTVESRLLQPMQALTESYSSLSASAGLTAQPSYSALLFGPPGTAKTTTATSMARYLGWNFLRCVVYTADFCELCKDYD